MAIALESNGIVDASTKHGRHRRCEGTGRVIFWFSLAILVFACGIYFGPQTITFWRFRPWDRRPDEPPRGWYSVPRPLADTSVSTSEGSTVSYYGFRFEIPWRGIEQERNEGRFIELLFKTGQRIRIGNPAYLLAGPIRSHFGRQDSDEFQQAFGAGIRESNYEQEKEILFTTPSQLSPFCSRREFARVWLFLETKGVWFEHNVVAPDIFSLQSSEYRGFEFSDVSHGWQDVTVNLFGATDREVVISISGDAHSGVRITQPEVNRLIQTLSTGTDTQPDSIPN